MEWGSSYRSLCSYNTENPMSRAEAEPTGLPEWGSQNKPRYLTSPTVTGPGVCLAPSRRPPLPLSRVSDCKFHFNSILRSTHQVLQSASSLIVFFSKIKILFTSYFLYACCMSRTQQLIAAWFNWGTAGHILPETACNQTRDIICEFVSSYYK
jgi:hypothetical protein